MTDIVIKHPLPEGVPDAVLNKSEAAAFLNVSLPTVDSWLQEGMPAVSRGTNGQPWELQASAIWAWKCERDDGVRAKSDAAQRAIEAMRLALVGGQAGDSISALPAKEQRELFAVSVERERLKRERNETFEREAVREFLDLLLSLVRDGVSSLPDRLERDAGLNAKQVNQAIESCDGLLDGLTARIREFFDARPVQSGLSERDLFNQ